MSDALPVMESMGVRVLDEHPYLVNMPEAQGSQRWLHDWGLQFGQPVDLDRSEAPL